MDSVALAQEIIAFNHKPAALLKLDFEKAYDKVDWDFFLVEVLRARGYSDKWIGWVPDSLYSDKLLFW